MSCTLSSIFVEIFDRLESGDSFNHLFQLLEALEVLFWLWAAKAVFKIIEQVVSSKLYQCQVTSVNGHMTRALYFLPAPLEGDVCFQPLQKEISKIP